MNNEHDKDENMESMFPWSFGLQYENSDIEKQHVNNPSPSKIDDAVIQKVLQDAIGPNSRMGKIRRKMDAYIAYNRLCNMGFISEVVGEVIDDMQSDPTRCHMCLRDLEEQKEKVDEPQ